MSPLSGAALITLAVLAGCALISPQLDVAVENKGSMARMGQTEVELSYTGP